MTTVTRALSWLVCNSDMGTLTRVGVLTIYFFFLESGALARVVLVGGGEVCVLLPQLRACS